jgi:hypothetical protein
MGRKVHRPAKWQSPNVAAQGGASSASLDHQPE